MTAERLKEIEAGVAREISMKFGWKSESDSACEELIAEVRQLQGAIIHENLKCCRLRGAMETAIETLDPSCKASRILREALQ